MNTIAIFSSLLDSHKEDALTLKRELGFLLARLKKPVFTHFGAELLYVKESALGGGASLISLSPACSKEEHETIFRYGILPDEIVLYTGLGKQLTELTLLRSASLVICLDEKAFTIASSYKNDTVVAELMLVSNKEELERLATYFGF